MGMMPDFVTFIVYFILQNGWRHTSTIFPATCSQNYQWQDYVTTTKSMVLRSYMKLWAKYLWIIILVDLRKLGLFIFAHCHFGKCTRLTLTCRLGNSSKSPHWLRCWLFLGGGGQKFCSKILERVRNFAQKIWGWRKFCAKNIGGRYLCKNSWGSRIYILAPPN